MRFYELHRLREEICLRHEQQKNRIQTETLKDKKKMLHSGFKPDPPAHQQWDSIPYPDPDPGPAHYWPPYPPLPHPPYYPVPPGHHWELVPDYPTHPIGVPYCETSGPTDPGCRPINITAEQDLGSNQFTGENID